MPSPQVVAREPGRRIKKSKKPERRAKQPVDVGDVDMETPTPSQQSAKAGPGVGAGRERSRRMSERMPKTQGARTNAKSKDTTMMAKNVEKKFLARADKAQPSDHLASPEDPVPKQPTRRGAKKQSRAAKAANGTSAKKGSSAASAEAAPTQKQVLKGKPPRKRTVRDEGVDTSQS